MVQAIKAGHLNQICMGYQTTSIPWKPYTTKLELYGTNIDFVPNSLIDGMTVLREVRGRS